MSKPETQDDIDRRFAFYRSKEVEKYLKKNGVPKSKTAMKALVSVNYPDASPEIIESLSHVHFSVHPQQINIRDWANESLIVSMEK
jgi:hypothetical protein